MAVYGSLAPVANWLQSEFFVLHSVGHYKGSLVVCTVVYVGLDCCYSKTLRSALLPVSEFSGLHGSRTILLVSQGDASGRQVHTLLSLPEFRS